MKILKSHKYIKKEALWSLPGDPNLAPGVTQRDVEPQVAGLDDAPTSNQQGESEIDVNWPEFGVWFAGGGDQLPRILAGRNSPSSILLTYSYSYDQNTNEVSDIKPAKATDYSTGQMISDPNVLEAFSDYFADNIKSDIDNTEENSRIDRDPDYIPF